jgi:hypothetical protein
MFHLLAPVKLSQTLKFGVITITAFLARNGDSIGIFYGHDLNHISLTDLFLNYFRQRRWVGFKSTTLSVLAEITSANCRRTLLAVNVPGFTLGNEDRVQCAGTAIFTLM